MKKSSEIEGIQFKWGKKRENSGEKDVQFYESFTYGGSEYFLYDCVVIDNASNLDSSEFFIGKIINLWEHNDQRINSRRVELLWFFKPSELLLHLEGVEDVLVNELFLASGTGVGLTNENQLDAISRKCNVLCISKDLRNPQPSYEEIKLAEFLFHRAFDVGTGKILEKIDDKIAGVDVKFIFNKTSCEKKASCVQKVATDVRGTADSLKPYHPSTSGSVRQNERNAIGFSTHRKSDYGYKKRQDDECHKQLCRRSYSLTEERSNKDSGQPDGEIDYCKASGSRRNDSYGKKDQNNEAEKLLTKQKSRLREEIYSKDSHCFDDIPRKKQKLNGSVAGRTKELQRISNDGRKVIKPNRSRLSGERGSKDSCYLGYMRQKTSHDARNDIRSSRDKVTRGEGYSKTLSFADKKQALRIPRFSEGKETKLATTEKGVFKKPSSDCNKSKYTEDKMLTNTNYNRHYRVIEVTRIPDSEESKWYRNLPWKENLWCAEEKGNLVLLQNLDPTYTSNEVENIVYSALNEQCTARMLERTSVTIPHIGEALVIFTTMDAAKRAIRRLDEGCLLLSNGRTLVATNAKVNPPVKPQLLFTGHIKPRTQIRQEMRKSVATSHCSQANTIEFDMGMDWCLLRNRHELIWKKIFERQIEEKMKLQMNFRPKLA